MRSANFSILFTTCLLFLSPIISAQTIIFSSTGGSYTNTDAVTTDTYGPVPVTDCSSISISLNYNFSLAWPGGGNMESSDECPFGIMPCAGDPTMPNADGCDQCWDFLYVQFQVDGVTVQTELIGVPGSTQQSGTLNFGPICAGAASTVGMIVQTQTWAANETVTFNNIQVTCWDNTTSAIGANPNPACQGAPLNLTATLTSPGAIGSSNWSGPGTIVSPAMLNTAVNNAPVGNNTYTLTLTDDNNCTGTHTVDVTVNASPTVDDPANITVCAGDPVVVPFTGTTSPVYDWTNNNTAIGLAATGTGDISFVAANVSAVTTATITITPTENGCTGAPQTFTITVNPLPTVNQPADVTACSGAGVTIPFSGSSGTTFTWSNDNPAIGLGTGGGGTISFTAANVSTPTTGTITVTPIRAGCPGTPATFTITIEPGATVDNPGPQTACAGEPVNIFLTGTAMDYSWINNNPAIGLSGSGTGDISFTAADVTAVTTATITVSPTGSCPGLSTSFTITINPAATLVMPADLSGCPGNVLNTIFSGSAGATFSWNNSNPAVGLSATGTGNISFTAANVATTQTSVVTVTPTSPAGCPGFPVTFNITVNPGPAMSDPADVAVCGAETVAINFSGPAGTAYTWTNSNTNIGLAAGGTGNISFTSANVAATQTGIVTVTPSLGGCNGPQQSFQITVDPAAMMAQPANITVCAGATGSVSFSGTAGATFPWTNNNTAIGLAATGTGNISFTAANVTAQEVAVISVTPTNTAGCNGAPLTFTITVLPLPALAQPSNITVCAGQPVTVNFSNSLGSLVQWTNSNTAIGLASGGSGDLSFTAANVGAVQTASIAATATTAVCSSSQVVFIISVQPTPVMTPVGDVTVCAGAAVNIGFTGSPTPAFGWTNNNTAIGLSASGSGNLSFTTAAVTTTQVGTVTVTPTLGLCSGPPDNFDITVHPDPTLTVASIDCSADLLTYSITITSNATTVGATAGTVVNNGGGSFTIGMIPAGVNVTLDAVQSATTCSEQLSVSAPNCSCPSVPSPANPANAQICEGQTTPSLSVTVGPGLTADWYANPTGGAPLLSGNTIFTPAGPFTSGVYTFYVEARDPATGCVSNPRVAVTLTVNTTPTIDPVLNVTVCESNVVSVNFTGTGSPVFNWTNSQTAIGLGATGAGNIAFTAADIASSISGNIVVTPITGTCPGTSANFTITVNPLPTLTLVNLICAPDLLTYSAQITSDATNLSASAGTVTNNGGGSFTVSAIPAGVNIAVDALISTTACANALNITAPNCSCPPISAPVAAANPTICEGATIPALSATAAVGLVVRWYDAATGGILLATGDMYSPAGPLTVGTYTFYAEAYDPTTDCASTSRTPVTLTVQTTPTIDQQPDVVVCENDAVLVNFSGTAGANFSWTNNNTGIGLSPNGTGNFAFVAPDVTLPLTAQLQAVATLGVCPSLPMNFTITINPAPTLTITDVLCSSDLQTYSVSIVTDANSMVSTQGVVTPNGPGAFTISAIPAGTNVTITGQHTATLCDNFVSVTSPNCNCPTVAAPFNPNNPAICEEEIIPALTVSSMSGLTVQWYDMLTGGVLLFSGASFTPPGPLTPGVYTYFAESLDPATGCVSMRIPVVLTINEGPDVAAPPGDQVVCAGTILALQFTGPSGTIFNWENDNTLIGLAASGTGNFTFTAANNPDIEIGQLMVTPQHPTTGCTGQPVNFSITVAPLPSVEPIADQSVCPGQSLVIPFMGAPSAATFAWTNNNTAIGLGASGTGNINFTSAIGAEGQSGKINVTPVILYTGLNLSCVGPIESFDIEVIDNPVMNSPANVTLCGGDNADIIFSSITPGLTYTWTNDNPGIGIPASGTGNINFTAPNFAATEMAVITVRPSVGGVCLGFPLSFTVTVENCNPTTVLTGSSVDCYGDTDGSIALTVAGGALPYSYAWSNGALTGNGVITTAGATETITNLPAGTYTVTVTTADGHTSTASAFITQPSEYQVNALITTDFNDFNVSCFGENDGGAIASATGGTLPYQFSWSNGETTAQIDQLPAGFYEITITDGRNCTATAAVTLTEPPALQFNYETLPTECGDLIIDANVIPSGGVGPYTIYLDGVASPDVRLQIPGGVHVIEVEDANGCAMDSTLTVNLTTVVTVSLPQDTSIVIGQTLQIEALTNLTAWDTVIWTPLPNPDCAGCLIQEWQPLESTVYTVTVIDTTGCLGTAQMTVIVRTDVDLYVPNVFSPNLDGDNEFWVIGAPDLGLILDEVRIFDRWGELVYLWDEPIPVRDWQGWNGKTRGKNTHLDVYVYYVWIRLANGEKILLTGDLTVIR